MSPDLTNWHKKKQKPEKPSVPFLKATVAGFRAKVDGH